MQFSAKCLLLAFCAAWAYHGAAAQAVYAPTLNPGLEPTQYIYQDWQVEDGLPQNSVFAVEQTSDGYLWLGTQEGLVRFDGIDFTVFDRNRVENLSSHVISVLLEDHSGVLWLGIEQGGLARYENGIFHEFTVADGLPPGGVRALFEDRDGNIWIGTVGGGLSRYDGSSFTRYTAQQGLGGDVVLAIDQDRDGAIWVGTNGGLSTYDGGKWTTFTTADGLPGGEVWSLQATSAGALWIGTNRGVTRLRGGSFIEYPHLEDSCDGTVSDLLQDRAGTLWVATLESGVCRVSQDRVQVFNRQTGLSHHQVRALYEDREGNIWIGTDGGGLNQLRQGKFAVFGTPEGLSDNVVYAVFEDRDGAIWIGTESGGLNRYHEGRFTHYSSEQGLGSSFILSLHQDRSGTIWAGTYDAGLCRLTGGRFQCRGTAEGLASDFVRAIFEDSRGVMWIGTDAGLHRLEDGHLDLYTTDDGLDDASITSILEDESGALWIGTWNGLSHIREDQVITAAAADLQISDPVLALHEDGDGILWIGTWGGGLCRVRGADLTCYRAADGLFDDSIIQILEDDAGFMWIGSNKGIARIAKEQFDAYDQRKISRLSPVVYDEHDGLRSREVNGGTQPAALKSTNGHLWFSTLRGVAVIDPLAINQNRVPPPVVLEDIIIDGEVAKLDSIRNISAGSRKFEFRYSGLSYVSSAQVSYQFRLEPYDDEWIEAGARRQAFYTNLPAGEYTFRVRAINNDGVVSEHDATLSFYVEPRLYETGWFFLLCLITLLAIAGGVYRLRTRQLKARQRALTQLVDERTRELQERRVELEKLNHNLEEEVQRQLDVFMKERVRYENELITARDRAEESARLKASILSNVSHEIRTPLTAIMGYSHILGEEAPADHQEFVSYISDNAKRLLDTLDSILELSEFESGDEVDLHLEQIDLGELMRKVAADFEPAALKKGLAFETANCQERICVEADAGAVEKVARKIVENAVKFTHEGDVQVAIGRNGRRAYFQVRDTGVGISPSFIPHVFEAFKQESQGLDRSHEGSGLGLSVARHLVRVMNGEIEVDSEQGKGSTFTVYFASSEKWTKGRDIAA